MTPERPLSGRVAVVLGASGGIGRAIAARLAKAGASMLLADREKPETQAADLAATYGVSAVAAASDVTVKTEIEAMLAQAAAQLGRIDILINAAGVVSFGAAATLPEQEWDRVLAINLKGTFLTCQAVLPHMMRNGYGRIVTLGSVVGKNGGNARPWLDPAEQQQAANVAYGVSKAGVHALTAFLAREFAAHGITVNTVAPGPVASEMTDNFPAKLKALIPVGRMGTGTDVAEACLFLASETSGFITGEILDVNGGMWSD